MPNIRYYSFSQETDFLDGSKITYSGNGSLKAEVGNDWIITITPPMEEFLPGVRSVGYDLDKRGGFAVTHIGRIQHKYLEEFEPDGKEVSQILKAISNTFTFAFGRNVHPILLVGRNQNKTRVWSKAENLVMDAYKNKASWSSMLGYGRNSNSSSERLINCRVKVEQNSHIQYALFWYLRARQSSAMDERIVVTQIGLEVLGWSRSNDNAVKWLPDLVEKLQWEKSIPNSLTRLEKFRQKELQTAINESYKKYLADAPKFFVGLRNLIVHRGEVKGKSRFEIPNEVVAEASKLGMFYLELAILHAIKYDDYFYNWLRDDGVLDESRVP